MQQRGRKSADVVLLNVDGSPPRLTAPAGLSKDERVLFGQIIASRDPRQFVESDLPLLVSYVQATLMAHSTANTKQVAVWEKAVRGCRRCKRRSCGCRRKAERTPSWRSCAATV